MISYMPWIKELLKDRLAVTGLIVIFLLCLVAVFAPYIAPDRNAVKGIDMSQRLKAPSITHHILGTDQMGRDILSRIIFGTRITILVAVIAIGGALVIGIPVGLVAGYYEGWMGAILMRLCDVFLALPQIVLALALASALGASIQNAILALTITYWPWWSRVVYAETLSTKRSVFVEASLALGASRFRTMVFHVLPNILSPIIVRSTIGMGAAILTAAILGYLGVGAQPPTPEWGLAVAESREYLPGAWWFATFPGLAIYLVVMAFNMFGDGLRDVLDPRLRISGSKKIK
jgi:peptide/nickel transport system permease protein